MMETFKRTLTRLYGREPEELDEEVRRTQERVLKRQKKLEAERRRIYLEKQEALMRREQRS